MFITRDELKQMAIRAKAPTKPFQIEKLSFGGYSWNWSMFMEHDKRVPFSQTMFKVTGSGTQHVVGIKSIRTNKGIRFFLSCGDPLLFGDMEHTLLVSQIGEESSFIDGLRDKGKFGDSTLLDRNRITKFHNQFMRKGGCRFKSSYDKNPLNGGCLHVRAVLHHICKEIDIEDFINEEISRSHSYFAYSPELNLDSMVKIVTSSVDEDLKTFAGISTKKKIPVLLVGEQGSSKTYKAREFARSEGFDLFVEVGGHAGMEAYDFIGGQIPTKDGMEWMDGPLTRAFRAASQGMKVCLLVDELYRIPRRERSVFLTSLSDHKGLYYLNTGRPIMSETGVLTGELVSAPVENLSVISTTNVGAGFDVEEDDNALKERWAMIYVETTEESLNTILTEVSNGNRKKQDMVKSLINFYTTMKKLKSDNLIECAPSVRTLCRVLEMWSTGESMSSILNKMKLTWISLDLDGKPIKEQAQAVELCVRNIFMGE